MCVREREEEGEGGWERGEEGREIKPWVPLTKVAWLTAAVTNNSTDSMIDDISIPATVLDTLP